MKKLSFLFAVLGAVFLLAGLYELFNPSDTTQTLFASYSLAGYFAITVFLILERKQTY
jgi:uncharacterized membrane protein HdeD (DUF308 family)